MRGYLSAQTSHPTNVCLIDEHSDIEIYWRRAMVTRFGAGIGVISLAMHPQSISQHFLRSSEHFPCRISAISTVLYRPCAYHGITRLKFMHGATARISHDLHIEGLALIGPCKENPVARIRSAAQNAADRVQQQRINL